MKILLDTHLVIWMFEGSRRFPVAARRQMEQDRNSCFVSSASVWELALKSSVGDPEFPIEKFFDKFAESGLERLDMTFEHAMRAGKLRGAHRDPFDLMLVAQAKCEAMTLFTVDQKLEQFGSNVKVF